MKKPLASLPAAFSFDAISFDDGSPAVTIVRFLAAAALILLNLVVFAIWTRPVNFITDDWTVRLADWEALRRQWEYSHAANAGITLAAFCASTLAALHRR
jgi:hypothetical protein